MTAGNLVDAVGILEELAATDYILKDYVLFDLAECYQKLGERKAAFEKFIEVVEKYKSSPLFKKAYLSAIKLKSSEDLEEAEKLAKDFLQNISDDDLSAAEVINIFVKKGRGKEFEPLLKRLFLNGSSNFEFALHQLRDLNVNISKAELKEALNEAYRKGRYRQIVKIVEEENDRDTELKFILGKSYFSVRNYNATIRYLNNTPYREGKIILASAFLRNNDRLASEIMLRRLAAESKDGLYELYLRFAELKRREGKVSEAKSELQRLFELYPEKRPETVWYLAWLNISIGAYKDAERLLEMLLKDYNYNDKDKILFWLGKIQEYSGKDGAIYFSRLNPKSYYAFRGKVSNVEGNVNKREDAVELTGSVKSSFLRAEELKKLFMDDYVSLEIKAVSKEINGSALPNVAKLLSSIGRYDLLLQISERFGEINSYTYPLAYYDEVSDISEKLGVDRFLVLAVMREESRFNRNVLSVTGAIGLMQLMPGTAKRYLSVKGSEEIYQIDKNIKAGVRYLSKLLRDYGNMFYAVAAYNAGENRVNSWLNKKYRNVDEFVEDIPFGETRNYVKKVMKSYYIYKILYCGER
ncbi:MAG: transglycosylase SLT domain-containing protein [bacterium]